MKFWQATIRLSKPGTSVTDEELTREVIDGHRMGEKAARVVKRLYGNALNPINQLERRIRRDYRNFTFEGIGNIRLLVVDERQKFLDTMRVHETLHVSLSRSVLENYDAILEQERLDKNGAFRIEDYPTCASLANAFGFTYSVLPMPSPNQFLVDGLTDDLSASLAAEYEQRLANAESNIRRTVLNTLLSLIADTAESLSSDAPIIDTDNRKGPLAKLQEYLDRIPALNITSDPQIQAIYDAARQKLSVSSDYLRNSQTARTAAALHAHNIATKFGTITRKIQFSEASEPLAA